MFLNKILAEWLGPSLKGQNMRLWTNFEAVYCLVYCITTSQNHRLLNLIYHWLAKKNKWSLKWAVSGSEEKTSPQHHWSMWALSDGGGGCLVSDPPQAFFTFWALWKYPGSQKENTSQLFSWQPNHSCDSFLTQTEVGRLHRAPNESPVSKLVFKLLVLVYTWLQKCA